MNQQLFLFLVLSSIYLQACDSSSNSNSLAANLKEAGGYDIEAVHKLTGDIEKDPKNAELYFLRGQVYAEQELLDSALADAEQALLLDTSMVRYHQFLADAYIDNSQSKAALGVLKKGLERFPDDMDLLRDLAEIYLYVMQYQDGVVTVDKMLKQQPRNPEILFLKGNLLKHAGDTMQALDAYQRSVEEDADFLPAYLELIILMEYLNKPLALSYIDNALRIDSANYIALSYRAQYYHQRGMFEQADEAYKQFIYKHPQDANVQYNYGLMQLELKKYEDAEECFDRAVSFDALFYKAYFFRAMSREALGKMPAAIADYRQALRINPDYEDAKRALEKLGMSQ